MRVMITFDTKDRANYLAKIPQLISNGHRVQVDGYTATFDSIALTVLAEMSDGADGYYDGSKVWIGGTGYRAVRKTGRTPIGPEVKTRLAKKDIVVLDWRARRLAGGDRAALIRSVLCSFIDDCPVQRWALIPDIESGDVPEFDWHPTNEDIVARLTEINSGAESVTVVAGRDHDGDHEWTVTAVWAMDGEENREVTSWCLQHVKDGDVVDQAAAPA
jgi:hypothetical protein